MWLRPSAYLTSRGLGVERRSRVAIGRPSAGLDDAREVGPRRALIGRDARVHRSWFRLRTAENPGADQLSCRESKMRKVVLITGASR